MEITLELTKWGFGLYSPWFGFDLTWGFIITALIITLAIKFLNKRGLYFSNKFRKVK
jgi:hypothetical protein